MINDAIINIKSLPMSRSLIGYVIGQSRMPGLAVPRTVFACVLSPRAQQLPIAKNRNICGGSIIIEGDLLLWLLY